MRLLLKLYFFVLVDLIIVMMHSDCKYLNTDVQIRLLLIALNAFCIVVMLQPFHYDPNEKNRHKFLVQTLIVPDGITEIQESLVCNLIS